MKQYMVKSKQALPLNFSVEGKSYTFTKEWAGPYSEKELEHKIFQKHFKQRYLIRKEVKPKVTVTPTKKSKK